MSNDDYPTFQGPERYKSLFAIIIPGVFKRHALTGKHDFCILEGQTMLQQIFRAFLFVPLEQGSAFFYVVTNVVTKMNSVKF